MKLEIKNLTKSFHGEVVLNNLSLDIDNVHALAIVGASGGGKTTLLRILAGLEIPDTGQVIVNGKEIIFEEKQLQEYRKTVAMVFQAYNLFPHMRAIQNIVVPLVKVHHMDKKRALKKSEELLERFGLTEHKDKLPHQLSGGQRQRVAIARALSIDPQVLLLDEPTSALDPNLVKSMIETIKSLAQENKELILVTHQIAFAKNSCDYFIFMSKGVIEQHGHINELFGAKGNAELQRFLDD